MGVVMVAVACLAIYIGGWVFRFLVLAGAAVMLREWTDMHRVPRVWCYVGGLFLALSLLVVSEMLFPADMMDAALGAASFVPAWTGFGVVLGLALLLGMLARRTTMVGGYLYSAIPAFALLAVNWAWFGLTFWMMLVTWATDIFAYFRSEEHTSELQSTNAHIVCRLLLEKQKHT